MTLIDLDTLHVLLTRVEMAPAYDAALEADLLALFRPLLGDWPLLLRVRSYRGVLDLMGLLPGLSADDQVAICGNARGDGPPGYVLMASLLRHLIARGEADA